MAAPPPSVSDEKPHENFREVMYDETSSIERAERQKKEKALLRKLDCFIAPVLMILMLISYLDRGNIGFAATQGMSKDINLKGSELNVRIQYIRLLYHANHLILQTAISVFYVFYVLAEFPSSILVKRLQFNRVIPAITFSWGLVCLCTGFIHSFSGLVTTRILLGFFEGCLFPSMTLLLCNWYKREELAFRIAFLFSKSNEAVFVSETNIA